MILLTVASWHPDHGGPFFSVGNLASELASKGNSVSLFSAGYPHRRPQEAPKAVKLITTEGKLIPYIRNTSLPNIRNDLDGLIRKSRPLVIHDNGMWLSFNHHVALAANRHKIPKIHSPRGNLDPWAFGYRNWKKRLALGIYQRKDLDRVSCFHAASEQEAENIRNFGFNQPIAVIPNGVSIPETPAHFRTQGQRTAVFMGRTHPVKNLPNLLRAWAKIFPRDWILELYGSNEAGHREELAQLASELGIGNQIHFKQPVYGAEKDAVLRNAQLLLLVSKSENFGVAAAEGLAAGLPVVASKDTPWECLEQEQAGWWVDGEIDSMAECLSDVFNRSSENLVEMGERGRKLAAERFGWSAIAEKFSATYHWVAGNGSKPSCVVD